MNREINKVITRFTEKALFFSMTYCLSISVSYCLIRTKLVATKGLRHSSIVLFKRLNNLPRLIRYMGGIFKTKIVSEILKEIT